MRLVEGARIAEVETSWLGTWARDITLRVDDEVVMQYVDDDFNPPAYTFFDYAEDHQLVVFSAASGNLITGDYLIVKEHDDKWERIREMEYYQDHPYDPTW